MRIKNLLIVLVATLSTFGSIAQDSQNINLLFHWENDTLLPSSAHNNTYNEIWGFVQAGIEYGVIGSTWGTHVFDLSNPGNIVEVASIKGEHYGPDIVHRDYHDYNGYLYMVSDEGQGISTLRIVDLQYLPDSAVTVYSEDSLFSRSHNIFIDTLNAKLYSCGGDNNQGVTVFSLANPEIPVQIGEEPLSSTSHDIFVRNDTAFINDGTSGLLIYDFSDAGNPFLIGSLSSYPQQGYNHSGWLNEDGSIYVLADETHGKDLKILDVSDYSNIEVLDTMTSQIDSIHTIPHNVMIKGDYAYVSYYFDGMVIFNIADPQNPFISGYYDTSTEEPANFIYRGCWGIYSFLPSGIILASDMQNGLFVFDVTDAIGTNEIATDRFKVIVFPNPFLETFIISTQDFKETSFQLTNLNGQILKEGNLISSMETITLNKLPVGTYLLKVSSSGSSITKKLVKSN